MQIRQVGFRLLPDRGPHFGSLQLSHIQYLILVHPAVCSISKPWQIIIALGRD